MNTYIIQYLTAKIMFQTYTYIRAWLFCFMNQLSAKLE